MRQAQWAAVFLALAIPVLLVADISLGKTYHDPKAGLIIHFPDDWRIDDWPVFAIVNFPPNQRPPQNVVPLDGGQIVLMRSPDGVTNISEWLRADRAPGAGDQMTKVELSTLRFGTVPATLIQYEEPLVPHGRGRIYYFTLGQRPFKAKLFYRGTQRAQYFESVLLAVLKNLELIND